MQSVKKALSMSMRFSRMLASGPLFTSNIPTYPIVYLNFKKFEYPKALLDDSELGHQPFQELEEKKKEGKIFVQIKIGGSDQVDRYGFPAPEKREGDYTAVSAIKDGWGPETSSFSNSFAPMSIESDLRNIVFEGDSHNIIRRPGTRETFFLCYFPEYERDLLQGLTKVGQKYRGINFMNPGVKAEDIVEELKEVFRILFDELVLAKIITEKYREDGMKKFAGAAKKMTDEIEASRKEWLEMPKGELTEEAKLAWKIHMITQKGYTDIGNGVKIDL